MVNVSHGCITTDGSDDSAHRLTAVSQSHFFLGRPDSMETNADGPACGCMLTCSAVSEIWNIPRFSFVSIDLKARTQVVWLETDVPLRANVATVAIKETPDGFTSALLIHGYVG